MTQLTSIENLRNSSAMQNRVTTVENFLKRLNPNWQRNWFFPIAIIGVSNGSDDCSWVRSHTGTHHKGQGNVTISGQVMQAESVIKALTGVRVNSESDFTKLNEAIHPFGGGNSVDWKDGIINTVDAVNAQPLQQEAGRAATPFEATAPQAGGSSASVASKPAAKKSVKPIATKPAVETKLDKAKALFADMTPKQKAELFLFVQGKVNTSVPATDALRKLQAAAA